MNKVESIFKDKIVISRGNYFLFSKGPLILLRKAEENIKILGIDGFYKVNEQTIQPSVENSVDFSSPSCVLKPKISPTFSRSYYSGTKCFGS